MILAVQSQKQCWVWQIPLDLLNLFVQAHSLFHLNFCFLTPLSEYHYYYITKTDILLTR